MGMTRMFGDGAITARVQLFPQWLEGATLLVMQYLGEELVKYAKDKHNYTDQTSNLTNSINYAVVRGKDMVKWGGFSESDEAQKAALDAALKMAATAPNAFSLIIVAGMNYAAYVEAKGYNVILPAELKARKDFPKFMKRLVTKANAKAHEMYGIAG